MTQIAENKPLEDDDYALNTEKTLSPQIDGQSNLKIKENIF